jgi:hypothetical protein
MKSVESSLGSLFGFFLPCLVFTSLQVTIIFPAMPRAPTTNEIRMMSPRKKQNGGSVRLIARVVFVLATLGVLKVALRNNTNYSIVLSSAIAEQSMRNLPVRQPQEDLPYKPSPVEEYIVKHTTELGWSNVPPELVVTCNVWKDREATPFHAELMAYTKEVDAYYQTFNAFKLPEGVSDIRRHVEASGIDGCNLVDLNLPSIFGTSGQLTQTRSGWVEPLLPPMRHPHLCLATEDIERELTSMKYLVHDWAHMCRQLNPRARTIFIDMGASLQFHGTRPSPALEVLEQYRKMGFVFDHIYGYEKLEENAVTVFEALPTQYSAAYHWINVGVSAELDHKHNPWNILLNNYNEDDFVVIKLDIDSPSIEKSLAYQLLNNPRLVKIIDQFYFEHHVNQQELARNWGGTAESVEASFRFFSELREKGVAAHFWV